MKKLELSPMQREAATSVKLWFENRIRPNQNTGPFFYLAGYAGSGKTSIALQLIESLTKHDKPIKYAFAAFTGKASLVLEKKGCRPSSTIHRLIYKMVCDEQGRPVRPLEFRRRSKADLEHKYDLLILDECSMVNAEVAGDLLHFDIPILVLGDPGQLPPVEGTGYFTERAPDFFLSEIHRQALESPILKLATSARQGIPLPSGQYGESLVSRDASDTSLLYSHDQVICGMNKTRTSLNREMRSHLGFDQKLPMKDDKLICLKNNWDVDGMMNGSLWKVKTIEKLAKNRLALVLSDWDNPKTVVEVETHACFFEQVDPPKGKEWAGLTQFTFGYAITCHKSQGSQWDSVLVLDESAVFREDSEKWLYTAITRAAERVTVFS
jgi:exodeoxyribonuclease-5